jgi:hypothetical protein
MQLTWAEGPLEAIRNFIRKPLEDNEVSVPSTDQTIHDILTEPQIGNLLSM